MPTTFTIRPATPDDVAPARALMIRTFEEDFGYGYRPEFHADVDDLQGTYLDNPRHALLVAVATEAGAIVGTAGVRSGGLKPEFNPPWLVARYDPEGDEGAIPPDIVTMAHERLAERLVGAEAARPAGGRAGPITLTPDDLPIIDRHPEIAGLYFFAGDCGSSFKTAPAIGRALAEWATLGAPRDADLAAFRLGRFAGVAS